MAQSRLARLATADGRTAARDGPEGGCHLSLRPCSVVGDLRPVRPAPRRRDRAGLPPGRGSPGGGGGGSEVDILSEVLDQTDGVPEVASDDIEKSKAMKAATIVQDLLASNQKEAGVGSRDRPRSEGDG